MTRMLCSRSRPAFALLAVLWILTGASALSLVIIAAAREAIATAGNRAHLMRAEWAAEGCLARARTALTSRLRNEESRRIESGADVWLDVDHIIENARVGPCTVTAEPSGLRIDVNSADSSILTRALRVAGLSPDAADSSVAALLDWIDSDSEPRHSGAEANWYIERNLPSPSNRLLSHRTELLGVRGLGSIALIDSIFDVEPGPVTLSHASPLVLSAIPGMSPEALAGFAAARSRGDHWPEGTRELLGQLSHGGTVVMSPSAWILSAEHRGPRSSIAVIVDVRIERVGDQIPILRRRLRIP